jgi:hypothetical protein
VPRSITYRFDRKQIPKEDRTYAGSMGSPSPDDYGERLIKYVPAEVLAFYITASAFAGNDVTMLWVAFGVGSLGTFGYALLRSPKKKIEANPRGVGFFLAVLAFACWAVGTTPEFAKLLELQPKAGGFILLCGAFLVPLVDSWLDRPPSG